MDRRTGTATNGTWWLSTRFEPSNWRDFVGYSSGAGSFRLSKQRSGVGRSVDGNTTVRLSRRLSAPLRGAEFDRLSLDVRHCAPNLGSLPIRSRSPRSRRSCSVIRSALAVSGNSSIAVLIHRAH